MSGLIAPEDFKALLIKGLRLTTVRVEGIDWREHGVLGSEIEIKKQSIKYQHLHNVVYWTAGNICPVNPNLKIPINTVQTLLHYWNFIFCFNLGNQNYQTPPF